MVLRKSLSPFCQTLLLSKNSKLCGGLKYSSNRLGYSVDAEATWPVEKDVREPFAGKALMLGFYKIFMEDSFNTVRACVVRNNPFSTISKCMELGFSSAGGDNYNELMVTTRARIQQTLEKFAPIILFTKIDAEGDYDLESF